MTLPSDLDSATAMLQDLLHDGNLWLGLATVAVILAVSGLIAGVVLTAWGKRR